MTTLTDIKFINSIIHWISDFPNSPIAITSIPIDLANPNTIYKILRIFLYENDFNPQDETKDLFDSEINQELSDNIIRVHLNVNWKIQEIERVLQRHLDNNSGKLRKIEGLRLVFKEINFYKLVIFQDIYSISKLCELLLKVGVYSSRLSTFGLTSIEFLSDQDKEAIKEYCGNDFKEIESTNLDTQIDDLQADDISVIQKEVEQKNFLIVNELRNNIEGKNGYLRNINDLKFANEISEKKYNHYENDTSRMNEDYIDSILWENDQFQKIIFSLLNT